MGDQNIFNRGFEKVDDNDGSKISDCIHEALELITVRISQPEDDDDHSLAKVFADGDIRDRINAVHNYLGGDFLDAPEVFASRKEERKMTTDTSFPSNDIEFFNTALRTAGTASLNCLYYSRGQALLTKEQYRLAVQDFECLLEEGTRTEEIFRVHHKLAQVRAKMREYENAVESLSLARKYLANGDINEKDKEKFGKLIDDTIARFKNKKSRKIEKTSTLNVLDLEKESSKLAGVHESVELGENAHQGRFAVASKDIPPGTLVAAGGPAVASLNPDDRLKMYKFCLMCLLPTTAPIPCHGCSHVVFCSRSCRKSASFHKYECELDLYQHRQTDNKDSLRIFMCFKAIIQKPKEFFIKYWDNKTLSVSDDCDPLYKRFWEMVTHHTDRDEEDQVKCVIIAVFLLRCLRLTSYMGSPYEDEMEVMTSQLQEEELLLGVILHHFFMAQGMNSHPLWSLDTGVYGTQVGLENIGSGVYPCIGSYFNHSCNPNTLRCNLGSRSLLITTKNIKAGEEVTDIYSMHYSEVVKEKRVQWLQKLFHFSCKCEACENNWKTFENLPSEVTDQKLKSKLESVEKSITLALQYKDLPEAIKLHLQDLELLEKSVPQPHVLYVSLRNSFQFCCWKRLGMLSNHNGT